MVREVYTDIFSIECDVICHQVNCQKKMGLGLAKEIRKRYPEVYNGYIDFCEVFEYDGDLLGQCNVVKVNEPDRYGPRYIANLFGQQYYGTGVLYTEYTALEMSFIKLRNWINKNINKEHVILAVPYKIGCGLAGGDWNTVLNIINNVFEDSHNIEVLICNNIKK